MSQHPLSVYIVQQGDTLWQICRTFDVDFALTRSINRQLMDADVIRPGDAILLPDAIDQPTLPPPTPPAATGSEVELPLSSFPGNNDDERLTAFMAYASAQTYRGVTVLLDENRLYRFARTQTLYDGFSIKGTARPQDQARGSMPLGQRVDVNVSNGGWFALGKSQTFGCSFQGMSIDGNSGNRLVQGHSSNVLWTSVFRDISAQNIGNVLGSTSQKLLLTACTIDGWWNVNNLYAPAFIVGGSDCFIAPSTMLIDSPPSFRAPGSYLIDLAHLSKSHIKHLYMTADRSSGIKLSGGGNVWITDSIIEGRNDSAYCAGALLRQSGGGTVLRDCRLGNAMADPAATGNGDRGVVHVTGGRLFVSGCTYERQSTVSESVPFVYVTGSSTRVRVRDVITTDGWVGKPVVFQTQPGLVDADDSVTVVTA